MNWKLISLLTLSLLIASAPHSFADEPWKKIHEEENLIIFEKDMKDSPIVAFKGEGIVDAPLWIVAGVLLDASRATEWVDNLEENKIVKFFSPTEYLLYTHIGTPFVLKDRDFVSRVKLTWNPATKTLTVDNQSAADPSLPETKYVRGDVKYMGYEMSSIEGGKKTKVIATLNVDPKGSVPKWIVNLFQRAWPKHAFYGIKKQLQKSDLKTPKEFEMIITQLKE